MINREDIFLREQAWQFILKMKINKLPVNSWNVAEQCGYKVLKYEELAQIIDKTIEYIIDMYDNDGFVFWSGAEQCFVICYNSNLHNSIYRWTIMHEVAHVVLGHISPSTPALKRIRQVEHPRLEREADGFARRVLCPSIVLHDCKATEIADIMNLCGISREAALYRSNYIKQLEARNKWRIDPLERKVESQFEKFISNYIKIKYLFEFSREFIA